MEVSKQKEILVPVDDGHNIFQNGFNTCSHNLKYQNQSEAFSLYEQNYVYLIDILNNFNELIVEDRESLKKAIEEFFNNDKLIHFMLF